MSALAEAFLREHRHPANRALHGAAWGVAGLTLSAAWLRGSWAWFGVGQVAAYGLAWLGHAAFEGNHSLIWRVRGWITRALT